MPVPQRPVDSWHFGERRGLQPSLTGAVVAVAAVADADADAGAGADADADADVADAPAEPAAGVRVAHERQLWRGGHGGHSRRCSTQSTLPRPWWKWQSFYPALSTRTRDGLVSTVNREAEMLSCVSASGFVRV